MIRNNKWGLGIMLVTILVMTSCNDDSDDTEVTDGNWMELSDYEGNTRSSAVAFVLGDKAYVGTGYNGAEDEYNSDFWSYDPILNYWSSISDFPGPARSSAIAFTIGNKGYIGTGYDGLDNLKDFWEYDATNDTWTQLADFPGTARRGAIGFSIDGYGYVGTGYDGSDTKDFYRYNPSLNSWVQIPSIGGSKRTDATAFIIDGIAYIGTGTHNGAYEYDFWSFDPSLLENEKFPWVEKTSLDDEDYDYSDVIRQGTVSFVNEDYGYIATGSNGSIISTVWEYDPIYDTWSEKTSFEGTARTDAVGFSINNRMFVATGRNSSSYFDDIWELDPNTTQEDGD